MINYTQRNRATGNYNSTPTDAHEYLSKFPSFQYNIQQPNNLNKLFKVNDLRYIDFVNRVEYIIELDTCSVNKLYSRFLDKKNSNQILIMTLPNIPTRDLVNNVECMFVEKMKYGIVDIRMNLNLKED